MQQGTTGLNADHCSTMLYDSLSFQGPESMTPGLGVPKSVNPLETG